MRVRFQHDEQRGEANCEDDDVEPIIGDSKPCFTWAVPLIQSGVWTDRFSAVKIERTSCCRIRLTPKVASKVSRGLPYRKRMTLRSIRMPISAATMKAAGIATRMELSV